MNSPSRKINNRYQISPLLPGHCPENLSASLKYSTPHAGFYPAMGRTVFFLRLRFIQPWVNIHHELIIYGKDLIHQLFILLYHLDDPF